MNMRKNLLITGGTGLTGRQLAVLFKNAGYSVSVLTRQKGLAGGFFWDPEAGQLDTQALEETDTIIHLAGTSIASGRWSEKHKKSILESRVTSTRLLFEALKTGKYPVKTFISASAVGFYGNSEDRWMSEETPSGKGFLGLTCRLWEAEVEKIADLGIRVVILRTGLLLAPEGGLLPVIARPLKWGFGAILGDGNQYMSWLHIKDLSRIYEKAVEDFTMQGVYNAVSPGPVTHREFMRTLSNVYHRPLWLPDAPAWVLKLFLGEKADLVLSGQRVSSKKITEAGFDFEFSNLEGALTDLKKS